MFRLYGVHIVGPTRSCYGPSMPGMKDFELQRQGYALGKKDSRRDV